MSYIHCSHDDHYWFIGDLQNFFQELVVQPFENHPSTQPWVDQVVNTNHTYHREKILKRGRANFSVPYNGLSPEDKVLIYCFYYMPMHLFSSYHIFTSSLSLPVSDKVVFIDFGCGPLTSGVAFWAFGRWSNIIYLGIDSSQAMLDKASKINEYGPNRWNPFFREFELICDYDDLTNLLDNHIKTGDNSQIIFNFCYFLASETLIIENLSDVLIPIVERYNRHKMCMVYQNPKSSRLHENWEILKKDIFLGFRSQITQSNIERFSYDSLINGKPDPRDVYFDILSNESSVFSNNHRGD